MKPKFQEMQNASTLFRSKLVDLLLTHLVCVRRYRHHNWDNNVAHRGNLSSRMDKMHTGSTWIDDIAEREKDSVIVATLESIHTYTTQQRSAPKCVLAVVTYCTRVLIAERHDGHVTLAGNGPTTGCVE